MVLVFNAPDGSGLGVTCEVEPDFSKGYLAHLISKGFVLSNVIDNGNNSLL